LRKLALIAPVSPSCFSPSSPLPSKVTSFLAAATLLSSSATSGSYPSEGGGLYINLGGDVVFLKHVGVNIETAWRATQGVYLKE